jgi:hypothetical protein
MFVTNRATTLLKRDFGRYFWYSSDYYFCFTTWKVASWIPDYIIGIFHYHNPSGFTMALGSTQLLTEMSTRNIYWVNGSRCVGLTTLPISFTHFREIWEPHPPGIFRACPGLYKVCTFVTFIGYDFYY